MQQVLADSHVSMTFMGRSRTRGTGVPASLLTIYKGRILNQPSFKIRYVHLVLFNVAFMSTTVYGFHVDKVK